MRLKILALIVWAVLKAAEGNAGYEMNVYKESPGVYFANLGHATLSDTAWTLIVYVPMQPVDNETSNLERYVQYLDSTCARMMVRNWTACSHFSDIMSHKLRQIRNTRQLLFDIAQREGGNNRFKRGLFNFVGKLSKALFGNMDDDDAQFYREQIERFEQGTTTLTQLQKQQLMIIKATLCTFNETLTDVE
jgi:hypothetical protein